MGKIKYSEISSLNFLAMPKAREHEHDFPSIFRQREGFSEFSEARRVVMK